MKFLNCTILFLFLSAISYKTFAQLSADAGNNAALCTGVQFELGGMPSASGGVADYTYQWSPATGLNCTDCPNPVVEINGAATYYLIVTDKSGATATDSIIIELTNRPGILNNLDTLCRASNCIDLIANTGGGIWSGKGVIDDTFCPDEARVGLKEIIYTVEDGETCAGSDTILVYVTPIPRLRIEADSVICVGNKIIIENKSPEGLIYEWYLNSKKINTGLNSSIYSIDITDEISRDGNYWVVQKLVNHHCDLTDSLLIKVTRQDNFGFRPNRVGPCGRAFYIDNLSISKSLTYNWDFGNGSVFTTFQPDTVHYLPAVSQRDTFYFLSVYIEDPACGDTEITSDLFVGYRPIPEIELDFLSTNPACTIFDTVALRSNLDFSDLWIDSIKWRLGNYGSFEGQPTNQSQVSLSTVIFDKRSLNSTTTDTVTLITYGRCGSDSVQQIVNLQYENNDIIANYSVSDTLFCTGDTVFFNNSSNLAQSYLWDFDDGQTSNEENPFHIFYEGGTHTIQLTAIGLCASNTTASEVNIYANPVNPTISYLPAEPLTRQNITLIVNLGEDIPVTYNWDLGIEGTSTEAQPTLFFNEPGLYPVQVTVSPQETNCPSTTSTLVEVQQNIIIYDFFPTAFSPNFDGVNDCYMAKEESYIALELLQIYNRWGSLVFETTTSNTCWDGKYNGNQQPVGVYVYHAVMRDIKDEVYNFRGNITLIR